MDNIVDLSDKWLVKSDTYKCKVLHIGNNNWKHKCSLRKSYSKEREFSKTPKLDNDLAVNVNPELKFSNYKEQYVDNMNI